MNMFADRLRIKQGKKSHNTYSDKIEKVIIQTFKEKELKIVKPPQKEEEYGNGSNFF